ncbi:MAG: DHHW family protein [Candidatus Limivicinus sp.]|jgi:hypothetical protein
MKKIFCFIFAVFILIMMTFSLIPMGQIIQKKLENQNDSNKPVMHPEAWSEKYPRETSYAEYRNEIIKFTSEHKESESFNAYQTDSGIKTKDNALNSIIKKYEKKIELKTNKNGILAGTFFDTFRGSLDKFLGKDINTVACSTELNTDYITETDEGQLGYSIADRNIQAHVDAIALLNAKALSRNINFIYFSVPNKHGPSPMGKDYSDELINELFNGLEENNIGYIDSGKFMTEMGMSEKDIFYDTDHHWKPSSGILANRILAEYLNRNCGYNINLSLFSPDNYTQIIMEGVMLGSIGKKVTTAYCDKEDFIIYEPKYNSNLTISIDGVVKKGTLMDTLFDYQNLENIDNNTNCYASYGYGDVALLESHNNRISDGSNIMLIKTSFADCMIPYLANAVENLTAIDLRHYKGSLQTLVKEKKPDTIIYICGIKSIEQEPLEGGIVDFR